jgi:hypothetical protein
MTPQVRRTTLVSVARILDICYLISGELERMSWSKAALPLIALAFLSGCSASFPRQERASKWTTGFWFWDGGSTDSVVPGEPLDVLFVQVGSITDGEPIPIPFRNPANRWRVHGRLPDKLPPAREYWLVFRFERQGVPDHLVTPMIANKVSELQSAARKRQLNLVGVQLDIDSPTNALPQYASFLREVRKGLPQGFEISITALLDWFRSGTAIAEVIRETDEFVPQFYDAAEGGSRRGWHVIASSIDAARWGPVFNRFQKRFRVGVSTFGRATDVPGAAASRADRYRSAMYHDLAPIDVATNPSFQLQASRNRVHELVLNYQAVRRTRIGYQQFNPADSIQFVVSTPEAVRAAVENTRRMGGHLAGVVFFRWPSSNETLTMQPEEVLVAAGLRAEGGPRQDRIDAIDGHCAAVACADLYFEGASTRSPTPLRYVVRGSRELEYFLPEKNMPVRMTGPSQLELSLPPYCARGRLYLGRAVSAHRCKFTVEQQP